MYVPPVDRTLGEDEWRPFLSSVGFGHLVAPGLGRALPVVVPTQFVVDGDEVLVHLVAANPVFGALDENPRALLSVAGDWAFVPSAWKAVGAEDPLLGIPTTYYGAVQVPGVATVVTDPEGVAAVLRAQLAALQPGVAVADPAAAHPGRLGQIRGIRLAFDPAEVVGKFKYGGNVDAEHRRAVIARLRARGGPGDLAAAAHAERRLHRQTVGERPPVS